MNIDKQRLKQFVHSCTKSCRILVVGDVMLDKYYYGEVTRISPEAPVPVNRVVSIKETMGGAANVAHNLSLLGAQTFISGFVGNDYHSQSLMDKFTARGIDYRGIIYCDKPTIAKVRIIGGHQQMLRLDFEDTDLLDETYSERMINYVNSYINGLDGVIISDYGKGVCTFDVCQSIIEMCNDLKIPVFVDPKGVEWEKYEHADFITPNFKETNSVQPKPIKNKDNQIEQAAEYIMDKYKIGNVLATRSECGVSFINKNEKIHIPTRAQEVFDVSGAGDTVLAVFALGIVGGLSKSESAYLANLAAGVVVGKLGTYAISREELINALNNALD